MSSNFGVTRRPRPRHAPEQVVVPTGHVTLSKIDEITPVLFPEANPMRLGLLADIHEDIGRLAVAVVLCRQEGADRLLTLGDVYQDGKRFAETVVLWREADVGGVWGNHEFGLCHEPGSWAEEEFDAPTRAYMARLRPRMEVEGSGATFCLGTTPRTWSSRGTFTDSRRPATRPRPDFAAFPHRRMFLGHYHRWLAVTPEGPVSWSGERPLAFDAARRYLVVIAACCDGWCAVDDTEADVLTPHAVRPN